MNIFYFYLLILIHPYISFWFISFKQAERKQWEALIPIYNYFIAFKLGCKKPWWSLLMIVPGAHLIMWSVLNTSYIRRFGYFSFIDTIQGIFFPYIILFRITKEKNILLPETNWANSKEMSEREWGDHIALFLALPIIGHIIALGLGAVTRHKPGKKSKVKEWGDSIIFALVAASIIRTYVFEPFQIPTGSMEKTLLVGDFLFVNKLIYGPKVPVTPLSYPLVHNTVPWINIKSYTELETLEYTRLPGFSNVKRNDVVVFNYPSGDTAVYDPRMPNGLMGHDYHGILNKEALLLWQENNSYLPKIKKQFIDSIKKANSQIILNNENVAAFALQQSKNKLINFYGNEFIENYEIWRKKARKKLAEDKIAYDQSTGGTIKHYGLIYRPVDKRENYIKRCVGIPGDTIQIINSILYVNNEKAFVPENQNLQYIVSNVLLPSKSRMDEKYDLEDTRGDYYINPNGNGTYIMNLTNNQLEKLKRANPEGIFNLVRYPQIQDSIDINTKTFIDNLNCFPKDFYVNNTITDFNKFQIPYAGQKIKINNQNIAWYRRIITAYEGHSLKEINNEIWIDNKKVNEYTFKMNYYWLMGDNRFNSADSRVWGFVPEDHIVGKASMVWFSKSPYQGIRWERLFNIIK
ncbi:MAG: signal peptidase I [Crocinitomicaceae bacterium]|nr:signal peptidase I [Crocinitomicaceae bacterium]